jgi:hypothetical protein
LIELIELPELLFLVCLGSGWGSAWGISSAFICVSTGSGGLGTAADAGGAVTDEADGAGKVAGAAVESKALRIISTKSRQTPSLVRKGATMKVLKDTNQKPFTGLSCTCLCIQLMAAFVSLLPFYIHQFENICLKKCQISM